MKVDIVDCQKQELKDDLGIYLASPKGKVQKGCTDASNNRAHKEQYVPHLGCQGVQ